MKTAGAVQVQCRCRGNWGTFPHGLDLFEVEFVLFVNREMFVIPPRKDFLHVC